MERKKKKKEERKKNNAKFSGHYVYPRTETVRAHALRSHQYYKWPKLLLYGFIYTIRNLYQVYWQLKLKTPHIDYGLETKFWDY